MTATVQHRSSAVVDVVRQPNRFEVTQANQSEVAAVAGDRAPWLAALATLAVVAFPAVWLAIQAVESFFGGAPGGGDPRPREALLLALMATTLSSVPLLVGQAVRRDSRGWMVAAMSVATVVVLVYALSQGLLA